MQAMNFRGRQVPVTGASSGPGDAMAWLIARDAADLFLMARLAHGTGRRAPEPS